MTTNRSEFQRYEALWTAFNKSMEEMQEVMKKKRKPVSKRMQGSDAPVAEKKKKKSD
jgi:hypothetical protein